MSKRPTVHFSNRLEKLAYQLGNELFKEGADPFAKRLVLLPSHSLKLYLTSFFASHPKWSVCAGITVKTLLNGALHFFSEEELKKFPSPLALSFRVEQQLENSVEDISEIKRYLDPPTDTKRVWLAEELSHLFYEYATSEGRALSRWLEQKGWKQTLWERVFSHADVLSKELKKKKIETSEEVHLFGFAHVPSSFYEFFCTLGMHLYFLSPSICFWEDLCSDQERIFLEKKMEGKKVRLQVREQMSFLFKQAHPLLANWGKVGRALVRQLGDTESYVEEEYEDPRMQVPSALTYLQSGILELEESKKELLLKDTSLLCLSATSKLREVEALFETIQEFMALHEDLEPKDILVLSPDLESYFPYIQMVFGSQGSHIGYSVHGLSLALEKESSRALMFFFSLAESRFDQDLVMKFFSFPSVMKKFGWELDDLQLLKAWFEEAHVLWGFDPEHKKLCLDQAWPEGAFKGPLPFQGTWEEGICRLIKGLVMDLDSYSLSEEEIPDCFPLTKVEWSDSELLGSFIKALASLQEDLRPVYQKEKKSLEEWTSLTQKWLLFYFEKTAVEEGLIKDLESLRQELGEKAFYSLSFTSFKRAIETHFQRKKESFQSSQINTVKFLSMQIGASFPSKIICAMGCDAGSFPRNAHSSCLNEKEILKETPSITEQDRYLFLEMILNARVAFVCSYQRRSLKDQKEQDPSLLIRDLMNDLNKNCFFKDSDLKPSQVFMRHHPAIHFDKKYFQEEGPFGSFSPHVFSLANSYYAKEKNKIPPLCKAPHTTKTTTSTVIEIKKLKTFAKDPMHLYLKETLGIFFDFTSPKKEEFFLSSLTRARIKKEAFEKGLSSSVRLAQAKGQLPLGEIGKLSLEDLKEDLLTWEEHLVGPFDVKQEEIFSLELSQEAKEMERKDKKLIVPPLCVEIEGLGSVSLVGELEFLCSKGFFVLSNISKARYIELFPAVLILMCLGFEAKGLFLGTGKTFSLSIEDPLNHLKSYIKLYMRCLEELCPVRPDWALDFLVKTRSEIEKKRETSFKSFIDPYEDWINKRGAFPELEEIYSFWEKDWKEVFSPLLEAEVK